jgi:hypothetical protein
MNSSKDLPFFQNYFSSPRRLVSMALRHSSLFLSFLHHSIIMCALLVHSKKKELSQVFFKDDKRQQKEVFETENL